MAIAEITNIRGGRKKINICKIKFNFLTEKFGLRLLSLGLILIFISIILFIYKVDNLSLNAPINTEKFNHFGSFIAGIIGTLWSLAGVILFYVALTEQRQDFKTNQDALKQQKESNDLQREELVSTRKVLIEQSRTLKTQQFESTFFNTLELLNNITMNINISKSRSDIKGMVIKQEDSFNLNGKNCFERFYKNFKKEFNNLFLNYVSENLKQTYLPEANKFILSQEIHEQLAKDAYMVFFEKHQEYLGHYFRTLYNIFKLVKNQNPENSKYYTNLVRSQLSTYEHLLLFYNCFSEYGEERFKPLIIEFSLLDNMPVEKLLDELHVDFYPIEAYK